MEERSFVVQPSFLKAIELLTDNEQLALYRAVFQYGSRGLVADLPPQLAAIFCMFRQSIDSAHKRYDKCRENGAKGGRPRNGAASVTDPDGLKKTKGVSDENLTVTETVTVTDTDTNTITETEDVTEPEYVTETAGAKPPASSSSPTVSSSDRIYTKEDRAYRGAQKLAKVIKAGGHPPANDVMLQWWAADLEKLALRLSGDDPEKAFGEISKVLVYASKDGYWSHALDSGFHFVNAYDTIRAQMEGSF